MIYNDVMTIINNMHLALLRGGFKNNFENDMFVYI